MIFFFFQAEDGIRDGTVTGVQTCALPICRTTEKTFCSRMRRAMSCVYWEPKSRMTIEEVSTIQFTLRLRKLAMTSVILAAIAKNGQRPRAGRPERNRMRRDREA